MENGVLRSVDKEGEILAPSLWNGNLSSSPPLTPAPQPPLCSHTVRYAMKECSTSLEFCLETDKPVLVACGAPLASALASS